MLLLRSKVRELLSFTLPTIQSDGCIYVKIDNDKMIFIAKGKSVLKRVILLDQSNKNREDLPENFKIPRCDWASFKEILKDQASEMKTLEKDNETRLYVEIDDKRLFSNRSEHRYEQPTDQYEEFQQYFEQNKVSVSESIVMTGELSVLAKGFSKAKTTVASYCNMLVEKEELKLIHYNQKETELEAVYICPSEELEENEGTQTTY